MGSAEVLPPVAAAACSDGVILASVEVLSATFNTLWVSSMELPAPTLWDAVDLSL